PAIRVELPLIDILTAHKCEVHRARIIIARRGNGSANAAPVAIGVAEAIPINARGLEASHQNATGPIPRGGNRPRRAGRDSFKQLIFRNLQGEARLLAGTWISRPKQDAVAIGIAGCDAFGKKFAALAPDGLRSARDRPTPYG